MKFVNTCTQCTYTAPSRVRYTFKGLDCWERAEEFKRWVEA